MTAQPVLIEIAPGELIDKITILEIKVDNVTDSVKLRNVQVELETLVAARDKSLPKSAELEALARQLKEINQELWHIEDDIRICERQQDFGHEFIALARAVYTTNDRRAAVKRQINELLGSRLIEEKEYVDYSASDQDE